MCTRNLAKELGIIDVITVDEKHINKHSMQLFDFLLILDFEATCWDRGDHCHRKSEIIEFPAVLYNITLNKIVSEFQQYVMPRESPKLSEFCTKLTGITQSQVENGVPLGTCLMIFTNWLKEQSSRYNLSFETSPTDPSKKKIAFVTWSDWDLGTCFVNECRRKRISKPHIFNKWIDLRALYIEHYNRMPPGLNGALLAVGLTFEGKQHQGLHDARNTAFLAARMISDGALLRITKNLTY